jgi:hypothetical protein
MPNISTSDLSLSPVNAKLMGIDSSGNAGLFTHADLAAAVAQLLQSVWVGKKIVWLGTSVPATGYPQDAGALLGATVVNKSIGGTYVAYDPARSLYGFSGTVAELTAAGQATTGSYETLLTDNLDADLFVFDHGHNDQNQMEAYKTNGVLNPIDGTNIYDKKWMVGGLNHVIKAIYTENPLARIAIVNEYRGEPFDNKDANRLVAEYWKLPIYEWSLGWPNVTPPGMEASILKYWTGTGLPGGTDYIHPIAAAKPIFAARLAHWLRGIA